MKLRKANYIALSLVFILLNASYAYASEAVNNSQRTVRLEVKSVQESIELEIDAPPNLEPYRYGEPIDSSNGINSYTLSKPELNLPEKLNSTYIDINNSYSDDLRVLFGNVDFDIRLGESVTLPLAQGENMLTFYLIGKNGKSETVSETIMVDTAAPTVSIDSAALYTGYSKSFIDVRGAVNERVSYLKINGSPVNIHGSYRNDVNQFNFNVCLYTPDADTFHIVAEDEFGNVFIEDIKIIK